MAQEGVGAAGRRCAWLRGALLAVAMLAAGPAAAQNPAAVARYRDGTQALAEHRYHDARIALREVVRLDPDFAGAWLDLALATYAVGDLAQAEELLDTLEARFAVPPPLAALISELRRRIEARATAHAPVDVWGWRRRFTADLGHDSNANAGLASHELTLTLPGGALVLPLARGVRARADNFAQTGLSVAAARSHGTGALELTGGVNGRRNASQTAFDTVELRGGIAWASAAPLPAGGLWGALPGPWRVHADVEQLRLGGNALSERRALGAEHLWPTAPCRPRASIEIEQRSYPVAHTLDATYLWLGGGLRCPASFGPASRELGLQIRLGDARARHGPGSMSARPGGDSHHLELTAIHEWAWRGSAGTQALQALVQWERVRDTDGYSPLLDNGAHRNVDRSTLGLTWSVPLPVGATRGWRAVLGAQQFRQSASLRPFDLSGRIVQLGVERQW